MSLRSHDVIEGLLALDALDGLSPEDRVGLQRERTAHGDCEECRRLEVDFRDTAGRMAFALEPVAVGPSMVEDILEVQRGSFPVSIPDAPVANELTTRPRRRGRAIAAVVGIAAALAVLGGSAVVAARRGGGSAVASASPAQTVVRFEPTAEGVGGELAMAYTPGEPGVLFWGSDLPDPGEGMTYELWMISGGEPVSGGCMTPTDGSLAVFMDADVGTVESMALTPEPEACPDSPTGRSVLRAPMAA